MGSNLKRLHLTMPSKESIREWVWIIRCMNEYRKDVRGLDDWLLGRTNEIYVFFHNFYASFITKASKRYGRTTGPRWDVVLKSYFLLCFIYMHQVCINITYDTFDLTNFINSSKNSHGCTLFKKVLQRCIGFIGKHVL